MASHQSYCIDCARDLHFFSLTHKPLISLTIFKNHPHFSKIHSAQNQLFL